MIELKLTIPNDKSGKPLNFQEKIRIMCKIVLNHKRSKAQSVNKKLKQL